MKRVLLILIGVIGAALVAGCDNNEKEAARLRDEMKAQDQFNKDNASKNPPGTGESR